MEQKVGSLLRLRHKKHYMGKGGWNKVCFYRGPL